jgi:ATP phosphoribosyltransferase regulatory subunit HisZ
MEAGVSTGLTNELLKAIEAGAAVDLKEPVEVIVVVMKRSDVAKMVVSLNEGGEVDIFSRVIHTPRLSRELASEILLAASKKDPTQRHEEVRSGQLPSARKN